MVAKKMVLFSVSHKQFGVLFLFVSFLFTYFSPFFLFPAHAVAATGYVRTDRMSASATGTATTGGTVCFTPQTVATEGKVVVTFPGSGTVGAASYGVNSTTSNWTINTTNIPTGSTIWPSIGSNPTGISGAAVTLASGDLTVGTQYCFNFVGASTLSNPTSANSNLTGTIQSQTAASAAIETINFALATIANDQIAVTATVPSTFSFSLSGNAATLGVINTTGATSATAITGTVSTNAQNGWLAWVKSLNAALSSPSTSDTIASAAFTTGAGNIVDLASSNGYVLDVQTGTGTPTIATEYAGNGTTSGGNFSTLYKQIASKGVPAAGNTFTMAVRARASATNKAATDYADTLTVTASGQF